MYDAILLYTISMGLFSASISFFVFVFVFFLCGPCKIEEEKNNQNKNRISLFAERSYLDICVCVCARDEEQPIGLMEAIRKQHTLTHTVLLDRDSTLN